MKNNDSGNIEENIQNAVLVALETESTKNLDHSLSEMESLINACEIEVETIITQKLPHPEPATYIGKGKLNEVSTLASLYNVKYCIFEDNLSPVQLRNIQKEIDAEVWDRTTLILEIFSRRAKTREAKLQVESAYLQYMLPRLSGMWQHLGRQSGGGGSRANKGIGETQLELDRRQINKRIDFLRKELDSISKTRSVQRSGRQKSSLCRVALVGYTNAGKSTIMNKLLDLSDAKSEKQVFQKDMLFATLDTSVRTISIPGQKDFLLSDTVGFIENLPHGLIKAFHSTLEEAIYADLIVMVIDASDPYHNEHIEITERTLKELNADTIPRITVMNKADLIPESSAELPFIKDDEIWMSAKEEKGLLDLVEMITGAIYKNNITLDLLIPFSKGDILNLLHEQAVVLSKDYSAEGTKVTADCPPHIMDKIKDFIL